MWLRIIKSIAAVVVMVFFSDMSVQVGRHNDRSEHESTSFFDRLA